MNIDNIQSALDTARFLFDETAFTVQYLMQKLEYLLKYNFIHKNDKIVFGKIGGQELYYINDIIGTEITKIDYDKASRIFMMFLNQNYKNVNDSEGLNAYKDNGFGLYGQNPGMTDQERAHIGKLFLEQAKVLLEQSRLNREHSED